MSTDELDGRWLSMGVIDIDSFWIPLMYTVSQKTSPTFSTVT